MVDGRVVSSTIDHVYTNCESKLTAVQVLPDGDSDHLGLVVQKVTSTAPTHPQTIRARSYKNTDVNALLTSLVDNDVNHLFTQCDDIEEAGQVFTRDNFYVTDTTRDLIALKNSTWRNFKETKDPVQHNTYKELTKQVKKALAKDRSDWLAEDMMAVSSSKKAWAKARQVLGQVKHMGPACIKTGNYSWCTNPQQMTDMLASHYQSKMNNLRNRSSNNPSVCPIQRLNSWLARRTSPPPPFSMQPISDAKLILYLNRLKPSKALPSDMIDAFTLKLVSPVLLPAIIHLVNLSIASRTFAQAWKVQVVPPNHKKGDTDDMDNFRPLSNLVEISKLTEMGVHDQLVSHFTEHNLFHPNHHGSLPHLSTTTAFFQTHTFTVQAAARLELSGTVFLDQSAAFNLDDHSILLAKLKSYAFPNSALEWFSSYLSNRSMQVQIEARRSKPVMVGPYGVP